MSTVHSVNQRSLRDSTRESSALSRLSSFNAAIAWHEARNRRGRPFRLLELPPEIRSMIWHMLVLENGPVKRIGHVEMDIAVKALHLPGYRHHRFTHHREPLDRSKYKVPNTHLMMNVGYVQVQPQRRRTTSYHPLTPAFVCRTMYREIALLYYSKVEHDIPPPFECSLENVEDVVHTFSPGQDEPIMFRAVGRQNLNYLSRITITHDLSVDWNAARGTERLGFFWPRSNWEVFVNLAFLRLLHLWTADLQTLSPQPPLVTNKIKYSEQLHLIVDRRHYAATIDNPRVQYQASLKSALTQLISEDIMPLINMAWPPHQMYLGVRLTQHDRLIESGWGKLLRAKAMALLEGADQAEVISALDEYFTQAQVAYCGRVKHQKVLSRDPYLAFL